MRLGDVVQSYQTVDPHQQPYATFTYVDIGAIDNKTQSITAPKRLLGKDAPSRARRRIRTGDVLFSTVRTYLKNIALVPPELDGALTSTGIAVLRPSANVDARFLFNWARSPEFVGTISKAMDGTMYPAVTDRDVLEQLIPIPPLDHQLRIVLVLESLFERSSSVRCELARIPELVGRFKFGVLRRAFTGELTSIWRNHTERARIQAPIQVSPSSDADDSFIAPYDLPPTWNWIPLPRLGTLDRGRSKHRPRNDPALYGGEYPFIQTGEVRAANGYITRFEKSYNELGLSQSRLWPKGTLCITIAANIAETAILGIDACFPDSVVGFLANPTKCNPIFIEFFIRTVKEDLAAFAPATAQKNINLETLRAIRIPCPPIDEQNEIVREIEQAFAQVDRALDEVSRSTVLLDRLDESALTMAFRGDLPEFPDQAVHTEHDNGGTTAIGAAAE